MTESISLPDNILSGGKQTVMLDSHRKAMQVVLGALELLHKCSPHPDNYSNSSSYERAAGQHAVRMMNLGDIIRDYAEICMSLHK